MENISLGSYLKDLREKRGVKLEEISRETKILKNVLEAIENNDFSLIPEAYLKGIIKKYCQMLKLKEEEYQSFINQLQEKWIKKPSTSNSVSIKKAGIFRNKINFSLKFLIVILFLVVTFYFLFEVSLLILPAKISLMDFSPITNEKTFVLKGQSLRAKRVFLNGKEIYINNQGKFEETLTLEKGVNNFEIKAVNSLGKETKEIVTIIYQGE